MSLEEGGQRAAPRCFERNRHAPTVPQRRAPADVFSLGRSFCRVCGLLLGYPHPLTPMTPLLIRSPCGEPVTRESAVSETLADSPLTEDAALFEQALAQRAVPRKDTGAVGASSPIRAVRLVWSQHALQRLAERYGSQPFELLTIGSPEIQVFISGHNRIGLNVPRDGRVMRLILSWFKEGKGAIPEYYVVTVNPPYPADEVKDLF